MLEYRGNSLMFCRIKLVTDTDANRFSSGASMVELMVALVIFSLAVLPILKVFSGGSRAALKHREYANAVLIAQDTIEICRGYNFEYMAEESQPEASLKQKTLEFDFADEAGAIDNYPGEVTLAGITYSRTVDIKPVSSEGTYKLNVVTVTIAWTDTKNKELDYEVFTAIAKTR